MNKDRKARLLELLTKDPEAPFLLFALAKEYEAEQNTQETIRIYNQLLRVDPNYTGAYYHLGKQYELLPDVPQAIQTYESGILICVKQKALHDASELRGALELITMDDPERA